MSGRTLVFRLKLPSVKVPAPKVVRLPNVDVRVNPVLLMLLAAVILYASFENTRIGVADVRRDIYQSLGGLAEGLKANLTKISTAPVTVTPTPQMIVARDNDGSELVKSLSLSVSKLNDEVSKINSLGRYYSSKLELTATVKVAAAAAAQKSYSENNDQCLKLSDSEDGSERNLTLCRNAKSIYYWVRDSVKYEPEYEVGYLKGDIQLPSETLSNLMGGSTDHAALLVSILRTRGMESYLVGIPESDYLLAAVRVNGLPDTYPDSGSWKTATSTGVKPPPYEYYGNQKDLVLLDPACKQCPFGKLQEKHGGLRMEMLAYYNRSGN